MPISLHIANLVASGEVCATQNDRTAVPRYYAQVQHSRPKRYTNWFLRPWMRTLNVRQADLVEKTGWSKTAVSLLCNERQDYTPTIIRDVAAALNLAPHELLMHPDDAMALRRLRDDALKVVEHSVRAVRTGSDG